MQFEITAGDVGVFLLFLLFLFLFIGWIVGGVAIIFGLLSVASVIRLAALLFIGILYVMASMIVFPLLFTAMGACLDN